jgi:hypothetical protein
MAVIVIPITGTMILACLILIFIYRKRKQRLTPVTPNENNQIHEANGTLNSFRIPLMMAHLQDRTKLSGPRPPPYQPSTSSGQQSTSNPSSSRDSFAGLQQRIVQLQSQLQILSREGRTNESLVARQTGGGDDDGRSEAPPPYER